MQKILALKVFFLKVLNKILNLNIFLKEFKTIRFYEIIVIILRNL